MNDMALYHIIDLEYQDTYIIGTIEVVGDIRSVMLDTNLNIVLVKDEDLEDWKLKRNRIYEELDAED